MTQSRLSITAEQADAIAALARLYMSTATLAIGHIQGSELTGTIAVESAGWRWLVNENGRVAGEGKIPGTSDAF